MPRTLTFPAPSSTECPICSAPLPGVRCDACGARFDGPDGTTLWRVDHDLHDLSVVRNEVVARLLTEAAWTERAVAAPTPAAPAAPAGPAAPLGPPPVPPVGPAVVPERRRPSLTVAELLVGAGAVSLVAAVVVFAAVKWSDLAAWAQGGLVLGLTGLVLAGTLAARRRGLAATAEALAAVTVALGLADVHVVRTALDGTVAARPVWAVGLAVLAVAGVALGRARGIVTFGLAGAALGFAPGVVAVATSGPAPIAAVLAAQAVAAVLLARPGAAEALPQDRGADRVVTAVLLVGAFLSGIVGASIAVGVSFADGYGEPAPREAALAVLVGLAAGLVAAGTARRRPGAVAAGALVAFLPAVMAVVGHGAGLRVPAVLVAQAAIAALVLRVASGTVGGPVRSAIAVGGVASWFLGGAWAVSVWAADVASLSSRSVTTSTERAPTVALLVGLAAVALVGARFGAWRRDSVALAGAGGVLALVTAFGVGAAGHGLPAWVAAVIVAAGAAALGAALLERFDGEADPAPWGAVRSAASVVGAALAVVPVVVVLAVVVGLIARAVDAPGVGAEVALADWLAGADSPVDVPGWASIVQLAGVALVVAAAALAGRRWWSSAAAAVAVGVVVVLPFALGLGVGAAAVGVLALAVGAAALVGYDLRDGVLVATAAALGGLAVVLAMGSTPLAVGTIAVVTALVVGLAGLALRQRVEAAPLWVGAAGSSVVAAAGLEAWIAESPGSTVAVVVAGAAALVGSAAALVEGIPVPGSAEPDAGPDGAASLSATAVDVVAGVGLLSAATLVQSLDGLSLVVLIAAVWAGVAATRPSRRPLAFVAAALGVVVVWLRLAGADVDVVEAYTVPLALWLLGVGIVLGRGRASWTSWARYGAGLVALVGPTALLAIADVDPARTVVAVVAGTGLALVGSVRRLQAPLAIGGATVAGLAVRHLAPVAAELPRYLVFAVAGLVLLALGATFEQRRRDLRQARDHFARLR